VNIVGVIPARYQSSRLPGKPIADICGKPMIWWVYQQAMKVPGFSKVVVAIDDERVAKSCESNGIPYIMTKNNHPTHINRVHEISDKIHADYYVCICGDEPLIDPDTISCVFPEDISYEFFVQALMREITEPTEAVDTGNIKIATNNRNECIMLSRNPIPFPYKSIMFRYKKIIGVECYNKKALDFFVSREKGTLEKIEDITLLRFLENHIVMNYKMVDTFSLSVDNQKDLDKVRAIMEDRISKG